MTRKLVLLTVLLVTQGCANLNTVHRSLDIGNSTTAKAVAIDGYQQPIFAQEVTIKSKSGDDGRSAFIVCPNPPVEAIGASSLAAALTNGFKAGQQAAGAGATNNTQASIASAMAAASIGLRTNSTTLLSYNATSNCLAYMGGATQDRKFMELARRNQHITLAILAIEQLTGVAQAGQASLNSSSSSATGTENLTALQAALDKEIGALNVAKTAAASAGDDHEKASLALIEKRDAKKKAEANLAGLAKGASSEEKAEASKAVDDAKTAYAAAFDRANATRRALDAAKLDVERYESSVQQARVAVELGQMNVRAQASATASVGQGAGPRGSATADVAKAVVEVVRLATTAIGDGETCASILDDFRTTPQIELERWRSDEGRAILTACAKERERSAAQLAPQQASSNGGAPGQVEAPPGNVQKPEQPNNDGVKVPNAAKSNLEKFFAAQNRVNAFDELVRRLPAEDKSSPKPPPKGDGK